MAKTYLDMIAEKLGAAELPITLTYTGIESYMCRPKEEGRFFLSTRTATIAEFTLVCMPGCCGIVISTRVKVDIRYRNKGIGTLLNQMRIQMAHDAGYGVIMCTDVIHNEPQQAILKKNNWWRAFMFPNPRTSNVVALDFIHVTDTGIEVGDIKRARSTSES